MLTSVLLSDSRRSRRYNKVQMIWRIRNNGNDKNTNKP